MEKKQAIRLEQARAAYLEQVSAVAEQTDISGEDTLEAIEQRFKQLWGKLGLYVPHLGHRVYSTVSAIVPIAIVQGDRPQISLRYEYDYTEPEADLESISWMHQPNGYGEEIRSVSFQWIHGPEGYLGEPKSYGTEQVPYEERFDVRLSEVYAIETLSTADVLRWTHILQEPEMRKGVEALRGVREIFGGPDDSPAEEPEIDKQVESDTILISRKLRLAEQAMAEYEVAYQRLTGSD